MYIIETTGEKVESFTSAIRIANELNSNVIESATGIVRWEPAPAVSKKAMRRYNERLSAYDAYNKLTGK